MFQFGKGEPQDYAQAAEWFRKAGDQGFPIAQYALGNLLSKGQGVPKNDAEAVMWWRRAAEQGNAAAQGSLGAAYQLGTGVPTDYGEAYFWWKVASAGEIKGLTPQDLAEILKYLGGKLSPEALSRTDERARKWLADHPAGSE
jgi:TPR repeat protein